MYLKSGDQRHFRNSDVFKTQIKTMEMLKSPKGKKSTGLTERDLGFEPGVYPIIYYLPADP